MLTILERQFSPFFCSDVETPQHSHESDGEASLRHVVAWADTSARSEREVISLRYILSVDALLRL